MRTSALIARSNARSCAAYVESAIRISLTAMHVLTEWYLCMHSA